MGVVSEIHAWNRGRELQRLRLKYAKMEPDAFYLFRGTAHLFFRDWPLDTALDDAPLVWVCGDSISRISARSAATTGAPIST